MKILILDKEEHDRRKTAGQYKDVFDAQVVLIINREKNTISIIKNHVGDVKADFPMYSLIDLVSEYEKQYLEKYNK